MKFEHPLAEEFEAWASEGQPLVPFRSKESEFVETWKKSNLSWILTNPTAGERFLETYRRSKLLGLAVMQGDCPADLHQMIYTAAAGSYMAFALVDACDIANRCGRDSFLKFSISMSLEGFTAALKHWALMMEYDREFDAVIALKRLVREMLPGKDPDARFWQHAIQEGFDDPEEFAARFETERRWFRDATRKKAERGTSRPTAEFKDTIMLGWLPFCFWTQTASEILGILDPSSMDGVARIHRIGSDISYLKIANSHRSELSARLASDLKKLLSKIDSK